MTNQPKADLPFVSVVMPVRNEEDFIEPGLKAILAQNYPSDLMEIIIADGMSTDDTRTIINNLKKDAKFQVTVIDNEKQIAATGLNAGIQSSKGDVIVRIDGHTIIEPDYVGECVSTLLRTDACNVGGRMNAVSENRVGKSISIATSSPFGVGNARFHYSQKEEYVDTVYMGAWRRWVFDKVGYFNTELVRNQDDEFNYRLRSKGYKILLNPKIKSIYYNRSSFKTLWRQYFQYGYWKVRVFQLHPRQMSLRQFIPFGFVSLLVATAILAFISELALWAFVAILGLYLFANVAATIKASKAQSLVSLFYVSLSFAILHVSYGLGFMAGLFAFINRWRNSETSV